MQIELYPHNEIALLKLKEMLKKEQFAAINHATGTGKSFIIAKYLYENKEKRILYLSPVYSIFDQFINDHLPSLGINKSDFNKIDNVIYPNILDLDMNELASNYDIIIVDEYHRGGAKKWGKKLKELKKIIEEKYPETKMIGLTATEIRYLDKRRNMTNELFNGNCASYLDLATAILEGILPAPCYINTLVSIDNSISAIEHKIDKHVFYKKDKEALYALLDECNRIFEKINVKHNLFESYINKNDAHKIIMFSSTIADIKKNKEKIQKAFKDKDIKFLEVHSNNEKEENDYILNKFKNANDGITILCAVDLLNEGIHVKGVDSIIMMRKTKSPIIYFQQLGRILSFSSRKEQLYVWDLVDNLNNHEVIRDLYQEVCERAKELIYTNPEKKEYYETILQRFKIIDNATTILQRLRQIDEIASNSIAQRLNTAITILANPNNEDPNEIIQANIDLFKYYKFVTKDMFKKIEKLDVIKPYELSLTYAEFIKELDGANSLADKKEKDDKKKLESFINYCNLNNKVPSALSNDDEEKAMAYNINDAAFHFSGNLKKKFNETIKKYHLSTFDRVYYGLSISDMKYKELSSVLKSNINDNIIMNGNVVSFLRLHHKYIDFANILGYVDSRIASRIVNSSKKELDKKVRTFIKENNRLPEYDGDDNEKMLFLYFYSKKESYIKKYKEMIKNKTYLLIEEENKEPIIKEMFLKVYNFISENHRFPSNKDEDEIYNVYIGYRKYFVKYGYDEKLSELLKLKKQEDLKKRVDDLVLRLIDFIRNNYGDLPSLMVEDLDEKALALEYNRYVRYFTDEQKDMLKNEITLAKLRCKDLVQEYINFIYKNKKYPLHTSSNEDEVRLAIRYKRNFESLSKEDNKRINNALYSVKEKDILKNTFSEIYNNRRK